MDDEYLKKYYNIMMKDEINFEERDVLLYIKSRLNDPEFAERVQAINNSLGLKPSVKEKKDLVKIKKMNNKGNASLFGIAIVAVSMIMLFEVIILLIAK